MGFTWFSVTGSKLSLLFSSFYFWQTLLSGELLSLIGGWVGYFSYDTLRYVEKKKLPFSKAPKDDRNLPDIHLGLYDDVIIFDHVEKVLFFLALIMCTSFR